MGRSLGSNWGDEMSGWSSHSLPVLCRDYGPQTLCSGHWVHPSTRGAPKGLHIPAALQEGAGFKRFSLSHVPRCCTCLRVALEQTGMEEGSPCPQSSQMVFVSYTPAQDQERRTPLHAAAYIGDVAILELLILSGKGQGSGHLARVLALPLRRFSDLWP